MEIFAPLSPSMLADPYPIYRQLQQDDPVHWHEQLNAWIVTKYADCTRVLGDPRTFIKDYRKIGEEAPEEVLGLQSLDAPEHSLIRRILIEAMRGVDVPAWARQCGLVVDKLLSEVDLQGFDFVAEFNEPLALASMCLLFGIPSVGNEAEIRAAQRALVLSMDAGLDHSRLQPGIDARNYMTSMLEPWSVQPPPSGLLSHVDFAAVGPLRRYVLNSLRQILVAGLMSTSSNLSCIVRTLAEHAMLDRDEPLEVTAASYNELCRHSGAVQVDTRGCGADLTLAGRRIRRGDEVLLVLAAANRDPSAFSSPEKLILDRTPNPHLAFGRGMHSCFGAHLALALHVPILAKIAADYRVTLAEPPIQRPTGTLRGLNRMVLRACPR